ncbi:MAG: DsbA family protein [Candidatus Methanosuratincola sp.]|jgi:predicted DsbA family dithiol-disulfide isomerase
MTSVTVFYDYICPFCFIGSLRISALSREMGFPLEWKGIEIHPEFPPSGTRRKRTTKSQTTAQNLMWLAEEEGIEITLPGFITNSRLALEAAELAKDEGLFEKFHTGIYEAYFQKSLNIGDERIVRDVAVGVGIGEEKLKRALSERTMKARIDENMKEASSSAILGVPTFVIGGYPLHGCQRRETMRKIIERWKERASRTVAKS